MIFGFKLSCQDEQAGSFLASMAYSINRPFNILTSPYSKKRLARVGDLWVLQVEPAWWRLDLFGLALMVMAFIFNAPAWLYWLLAIISLVLAAFFYAPIYKLSLRLGLLKVKSKAKVVFVSGEALSEVLAFGAG